MSDTIYIPTGPFRLTEFICLRDITAGPPIHGDAIMISLAEKITNALRKSGSSATVRWTNIADHEVNPDGLKGRFLVTP